MKLRKQRQDARDMSRICDNILEFIGPEKEKAYRAHFDSVDKDGDGILTPEELIQHFKALGMEIHEEACKFLFEDVDANGDGKLQFEEFVVMVFQCNADLDKLRSPSKISEETIRDIMDGYNALEAAKTCRQKTWILFDQPSVSIGARIIATVIIITILVSCIIMIVDSMSIYYYSINAEKAYNFFMTGPTNPHSVTEWWAILQVIDIVCTSIFTVEFIIRITCTPNLLTFVKGPMNWIDLLAILPMFMDLLWLAYAASTNDWDFDSGWFSMMKVLRMFRLVRMFKLTRYFSVIQNLFASVKHSCSAFAFTLMAIFIIVIIASSLLFFIERGTWDPKANPPGWINPDGTRNDPDSVMAWIYWCIICMTQVGYGSGAHGEPKTTFGLIVGCVVALMNILVYAIPISILGARFLSEDDLSRRTLDIKIDRLRLIKSTVKGWESLLDGKIKSIMTTSQENGENKTLNSILEQLAFENSSALHTQLSNCIKKHHERCHRKFLEMHEKYQKELMAEAKDMLDALLNVNDSDDDESATSGVETNSDSEHTNALGEEQSFPKSSEDELSTDSSKLTDYETDEELRKIPVVMTPEASFRL